MARLMADRGAEDYDELWRWSVEDLEGFWAAVWERFDVGGEHGACWRTRRCRARSGSRARAQLRRAAVPRQARRPRRDRARVRAARAGGVDVGASCASRPRRSAPGLAARGVGPGDRVAAYLPNVPETIAAFLATASLGAVWSSAAPEFGARSVVDRFGQIEPKVLLAVDGYRYGGQGLRPPRGRRSDRRGDRRAGRAARATSTAAAGRTASSATTSSRSSRCRSTTRSGCSTRRARPGCRRRSCRARAGSCSSTSR